MFRNYAAIDTLARAKKGIRIVNTARGDLVNPKALADAIEWGKANKLIPAKANVLIDSVAAVSVGIIKCEPMLDLAYVEDVRAETDMNVVATGAGKFVEVQGTAEGVPFDRDELNALLDIALKGTSELTQIQQAILAEANA